MSHVSTYGSLAFDDDCTNEEEAGEALTPTPARRGALGRGDQNKGTPAFSAGIAKRRISGLGLGRRISSGAGAKGREEGGMGPPERRPVRKLSGVGETF